MSLAERIKSDMIESLKNKETDKLSSLRLLVSELEKEKVLMRESDISKLSDEQVFRVINRQIKSLRNEILSYEEIGRSTDKQNVEMELLLSYMPNQASDKEIKEYIRRSLRLVELGEIRNPMQYLSAMLNGRADMSSVARAVNKVKDELK